MSAVSAADNSTADVVNIDDSKFSIENTREDSLNEEILNFTKNIVFLLFYFFCFLLIFSNWFINLSS